jgi:hypothetical protein
MSLSQDGALGGDQGGADGHATFFTAFSCLGEGGLKASVRLHGEKYVNSMRLEWAEVSIQEASGWAFE